MKITDMPTASVLTTSIKESLDTIVSTTTDERLRAVADDVMRGKRDIRDILTAPGIVDAFKRGLRVFEEAKSAMSDKQRHELDVAAQKQARELESDPLIQGILRNHINMPPREVG
jgi:hypothetical protein